MLSGRRVAKKGGHPALSPTVRSTNDVYCPLCLLVKLSMPCLLGNLPAVFPINGRPRELRLHANPVGRTMIQVDGVTVYDKWPIV